MGEKFTVERSTTITAAPDAVWSKIGDLTQWNDWSPWAELDPEMDTVYTGEPGAVGSSSAWSGNRKVGQGSMTITSIDAPNRVDIDLNFIKPFKAQNDVEMVIDARGDEAEVTWRMHGEHNFMTKLMARFGRTMDKMVGPDFEKGLGKLKTIVET
ncbi:MAG: SRPBCC family protein [Actinomycetota bacterium]